MKINVICRIFGQYQTFAGMRLLSNLQAILYLSYDGTLRYKGKELSFYLVRKWDDEENKDHHLCHEQKKNLSTAWLAFGILQDSVDGHHRRVDERRHLDDDQYSQIEEDWKMVTKL